MRPRSASAQEGSKNKEVRLKPARPVPTPNDPTSCGAAESEVYFRSGLYAPIVVSTYPFDKITLVLTSFINSVSR